MLVMTREQGKAELERGNMPFFRLLASAVLLTSGSIASVNARPVTVEQMAQSCRSEDTYCYAYLDGIQTMMQANCQRGGPPDLSIGWFPSIEAGRSAFLLWTENNPDQANVPAFHGVVSSLVNSFRCN